MEKVSLRDKAKKSNLNSRACKTCKFKYTCALDHHLYPCLNAYENGFIKGYKQAVKEFKSINTQK